MAPTFIFAIAGQLLGKISSPILQELSLAWGFTNDLRRLENTISTVRAVLLDAQERQSSSHQLKDWLDKLEDALYHAEHVLEEFEIDALGYKASTQSILRKVSREFSSSNRIIFRFKIAHKIKKIREEFDEITADRNKFNLIERFDEKVVAFRERTHSYVREDDVIGRDEERDDVIRFLLANTNDESVPVLPIVGLGGIGKTTLAKLAYNDLRVVEHFDLRIWVCISEEFELGKVIKEILKSAEVTDCDNIPVEQLQKCLRRKLENNKYLLILDDVWNESHAKWIDLKNFLTSAVSGSKIIVTTRNQSVALIMATTDHTIKIRSLSDEECLSLFLKWAFRSRQDVSRNPRLVEIAVEIVKKCKGIPLAVRTLGSILYAKTEESEWINVRDNEIWNIEQKEGGILPALKLSYYHLSTNLRRCFAFCSIFPKDYYFTSIELTMMWQANGLLKKLDSDQNFLDVGMMYIKQLRSRGFFQDFFEDLGTFLAFKMHDFVHDLALVVSGYESVHMNSLQTVNSFSTREVRHISFPENYFSTKDIPSWLLRQKENVQTFTFPSGMGASKTLFIDTCISKFKSLRQLDLRDSSFEVLPSSIRHMKHLKYLSLSGNRNIKSLPDGLCELVSLETLHFTDCVNIEKLPRAFGKLIRLTTLGITTKEPYLPDNEIRCLTSLQNLVIASCPNLKFVMSDDAIQCISALRMMMILGCENLASLPIRGLRELIHLEALDISYCRNLVLKMEIMPKEVGLRNFQILALQGLPKLERIPIWLLHSANNLKFIRIYKCPNLTNLLPQISIDHLKSFQKLIVSDCPKLTSLPARLHCLKALNEVQISNCAKLISRCQREIGEDWHKISHVPNIYLDAVKI